VNPPRGNVRYHDANDPSSVYRIYNADDEVIYVGMSYVPAARIGVHRRTKPWGGEIVRWQAEWHPNRGACQLAEEQLIKELWPRYNVVHTPEHRMRSVLHMPAYVHERAAARIKADHDARAATPANPTP
jgi:hypothetical protein